MDRKEFILHLWTRLGRPLIACIFLLLILRFLIPAIRENDGFWTILVLAFLAVAAFVYLLGILLPSMLARVHSLLPEKIRFILRIAGKTLEYTLLPILGIIIYKAWEKDKYWAMTCITILLADRIWAIVKKKEPAWISNEKSLVILLALPMLLKKNSLHMRILSNLAA